MNDSFSDQNTFWAKHFLNKMAYAHGKPPLLGELKREAEDFIVTEYLAFEFTGDGDHLCVFVEKYQLNTLDVLSELARYFSVPRVAVGYCGLKDKRAVTRQWFSIDMSVSKAKGSGEDILGKAFPLPKEKDPDAKFVILEVNRNRRKLKVGSHKENAFELLIKNIVPASSELDLPKYFSDKFSLIESQGFPNYFGQQRFGNNYNNLYKLDSLALSRSKIKGKKQSMLVSSLRSVIFNKYLSHRLSNSSWDTYLLGDVLQLNGSSSYFVLSENESGEEIKNRLLEGDIHISGPLQGLDASEAQKDSLSLESEVCEEFAKYTDILIRNKLNTSRRALRAFARELSWELNGDTLALKFRLQPGIYASSLAREVVNSPDD